MAESVMIGIAGLAGGSMRVEVKLTPEEDARCLQVIMSNPHLSPWQLSVKLLAEEGISVSESALLHLIKKGRRKDRGGFSGHLWRSD